MLLPLQFATQTAKDDSLPGKDTARLLNLYPEAGENGVTLRSPGGLLQKADVGPGKPEAAISSPDGIYMAVGGAWKLWNGSTVSTLGSLATGTTTLARNRTQIAAVAGTRYYVWNGTTISEVTTTETDYPNPDIEVTQLPFANAGSVAYLSNYFLISEDRGEAFAYTLDADTIDGLDFASAEYGPDNLVRIMVSGDLIWMLGERTTEVWQVTGAAALPFGRITGATKEKGLRSRLEAVVLDNTLFFTGQDGRPYRMAETPQVIGTDAMCAAVKADTGRVLAFQERRHDFVTWALNGRPACVYDPSTGMWWERSTGPTHEPWEVTATVEHEGTWYALTTGGKLCTFSGYQDLGEPIRREAISANITQAGNRFTVERVNLRVSGSGNVMLSYSVDGGRTFSNERQRAFGQAYDYPIEVNIRRNCRQFCLKIAMTDNAEFSIHSAGIEVS